ncbi:MAG: hypothetical protein WCF85_16255 [Rhodospirillaceae bacterium]
MSKEVVDLIETMKALDDDSRRALEKVAGRDPCDLQTEPNREFFPYGSARLNQVGRSLSNLERWCKGALEELPKPERGRPCDDALLDTVVELARVWWRMTGLAPTRILPNDGRGRVLPDVGPFGKFARAALRPVGVDVSDDMTRRAIAAHEEK